MRPTCVPGTGNGKREWNGNANGNANAYGQCGMGKGAWGMRHRGNVPRVAHTRVP